MSEQRQHDEGSTEGAVELLARANIQAMTEVRGLRDDIAAVDAKRGRDLNLAKLALAMTILLVIATMAVAISNRPILNLIKSTVTPEGDIYQENQARTGVLLQSLVSEEDCRNRRASAGLPPPPTTIVIKGGQATAIPKAPCGDLPDSPTGFQSPPKSEQPPEVPDNDDGFNPVPYGLVLAFGATIGVGAVIYRTRERKDPR